MKNQNQLEEFDPEVKVEEHDSNRCVVDTLDSALKEVNRALVALEQKSADFDIMSCDCDFCRAVQALFKAMESRTNTCSCTLCSILTKRSHPENCACKMHRAARSVRCAVQIVREMLE